MSLHKFADMVAKQGRGDDSLLIHMTPDEVQRLQSFAEANGRSLTINPETGLPEAGMLSDLFKAVAPIALGAFLGPAGAAIGGGFMSAGMAGLTVGGLTTLATGSLSRGLMAGLGAYGGAGLGESLMNAGTGGLAATDIAAQQAAGSFPTLAEGATQEQIAKYATDVGALRDTALSKAGEASLGAKASAGLGAIAKNPGAYGSDLFKYGSAAAAPIMAGAMVPTTTSMPSSAGTGFIRQKIVNPDGTVRDLTPVKASEWGSRNFSDVYRGYNGGGIVALAGGGDVQRFAVGDVVKADIDKAYAAGDYAKVNELAQANKITAADVADTWKGFDTSGLAGLGVNLYTPDYGAVVNKAYENIGRSGIGEGAQNIDQGGYDFWTNALKTGAVTEADLNKQFTSSVNQRLTETPDDKYSDYVQNFAVNKFALPTSTAADFTTGTQNLGVSNAGLADALEESGYSKAAQYALTHAQNDKDFTTGIIDSRTGKPIEFYNTIGYKAGDLPGDEGGLKGYYANINYAVNGLQSLIDAGKMTVAEAQNAALGELDRVEGNLKDVKAATGKDFGNLFKAKTVVKKDDKVTGGDKTEDKVTDTTVVGGGTKTDTATTYDNGAFGNYGSGNKIGTDYLGRQVSIATPGDIITNTDNTRTVVPNIPGRPYGGFTGMDQVKSAYTAGGGSLGYTSKAPRTIEEFNQLYNKQTGDSLAAYNYLMGKGAYPTKSGVGEIARPYSEATLGYPTSTNKMYNWDPVAGKMVRNFDYVAPGRDAKGNVTYGMSLNDIKKTLADKPLEGQALYDWAMTNNLSADDIAAATGQSLSSVYAQFRGAAQAAAKKAADDKAASETTSNTQISDGLAAGGMASYAMGGGLGSLGSYSDGGRLLKGPGDGVSDSIPATIGAKQQPARLADGEFVIPARIVSELGNGSTDAGAKKLYAMMDRVQKARGKTTGKNKVAANSRADKYLPA